jgi:hypothetical protein
MTARPERTHDPRITVIQHELFNEGKSKADKYRDLVIGQPGWGPLVAFELVNLFSFGVPGALGLFLRSKLYPLVLGSIGRNVVFGVNVTRSPSATTSSSTTAAVWMRRARTTRASASATASSWGATPF